MLDFTAIDAFSKIINENDSFIITSHVNPDADAIGSEIAIAKMLEKLDKKFHIINHNETPSNLVFLDEDKIIEKYNPDSHNEIIDSCDVLIVADLNSLQRTISLKEKLEAFSGIKVCIDHHEYPEDFADLFLHDIEYTSTGEIIYDFITKSKIVEIDKSIAVPLYAAVMTDTGSFRFDRTSSKTHLLAADLLDKGVDPKSVYEKIYDQNKIGRTNLLGQALSELKLNSTGEICYMSITQQMLEKYQTIESDVDGFVNFCLSIENVKIGILFFELKDGMKISFRSRTDIAVNKLAAVYGGGGHFHAAGLRLFNVNYEQKISEILSKAEEYLK